MVVARFAANERGTAAAACKLGAGLLLCAVLCAPAARAATFVIVSGDPPGEGLNSTAARAPIGGNSGTTLGAQRRIALESAAQFWGDMLDSDVPITVSVTFDALSCDGVSATLGSAGPTGVFRDFAGAPRPGTWYVEALANSLAHMDLDPSAAEIEVQLNGAIDTDCLPGMQWDYGLDGAPAADGISLVEVVRHELAHGLGFLTLADPQTGRLFFGLPDAFLEHLEDHSLGRLWPTLSNAQRAASAVDSGDLHWVGDAVLAASGLLRAGRDALGHVRMYAPASLLTGSSVSHFDEVLTPDEIMEPFLVDNPSFTLAVAALRDMGWKTVDDVSASPSPTPTPTAVPRSPSPTRTPVPCVADCGGDHAVSVADLIDAVGISLETRDPSQCRSADQNGDGRVTIDELIRAVASALFGCVP